MHLKWIPEKNVYIPYIKVSSVSDSCNTEGKIEAKVNNTSQQDFTKFRY